MLRILINISEDVALDVWAFQANECGELDKKKK